MLFMTYLSSKLSNGRAYFAFVPSAGGEGAASESNSSNSAGAKKKPPASRDCYLSCATVTISMRRGRGIFSAPPNGV